YGKLFNEMIVTNVDFGWNGACAHYVRGSGWDGYTCEVKTPELAIVRVSMMLFKNSESDNSSFSLRQNYWNNAADFEFRVRDGQLFIYHFCSREEEYPLIGEFGTSTDEWFPFSFTLDYSRYVLTSLTFGDLTTNYVDGIPLRNMPNSFTNPTTYFDKFAISGAGSEVADAMLYLDDFTVEILPRESAPIPSWGTVTNLGGEGMTNLIATTVVNYGSADFDYALSVLDHSDCFLPYSVSGTVSRSSVVRFVLYKNYLADAFYRSRVVMDYADLERTMSGSLTSLYTFSKGGWYYTADFEEPFFHEGPLDGQDTWKAKGDQQVKDLSLYMGGQGYARTSLKIPVNSEYKIKFHYLMDDSEGEAKVRISGDNAALRDMDKNLKGNFPLYITSDQYSGTSVLSCVIEGEMTTLMEAPLGEWNDLSVVVDTAQAAYCVRSISLNGDTMEFDEGELPLEERYFEKEIDMFDINVEGEAGFYIDNLTVCAPDLPEPSFAIIFVLAAFMLLKEKN
ncbi:hypothetical protein J6T93_01595, partial [bacterium]|nr:hypothetical protein [bacterium]